MDLYSPPYKATLLSLHTSELFLLKVIVMSAQNDSFKGPGRTTRGNASEQNALCSPLSPVGG